MSKGKLQIPQHISVLVDALAHWIAAATRQGVGDAEAEKAGAEEAAINAQLHMLGWAAVLSSKGRWVPILDGYTIVTTSPDPFFYPQRCYHLPESPDQWRTIWQEDREVRFTSWEAAYAFVFEHLAQEQAQLPLKRFCVRSPGTCGGNDYVATSADQALQLHLNSWLSFGWITAQRAVELQFEVFEHCAESTFYCRACQHAPCKYVPDEQWPMSPIPGWIASS